MKIAIRARAPPNIGGRVSRRRMLFSADNGAASLCIFEQWVAPGTGAPTHIRIRSKRC